MLQPYVFVGGDYHLEVIHMEVSVSLVAPSEKDSMKTNVQHQYVFYENKCSTSICSTAICFLLNGNLYLRVIVMDGNSCCPPSNVTVSK